MNYFQCLFLQAVECAQQLVDAGVIEHVSKECKFEDKEQFYRFTSNDNRQEVGVIRACQQC